MYGILTSSQYLRWRSFSQSSRLKIFLAANTTPTSVLAPFSPGVCSQFRRQVPFSTSEMSAPRTSRTSPDESMASEPRTPSMIIPVDMGRRLLSGRLLTRVLGGVLVVV